MFQQATHAPQFSYHLVVRTGDDGSAAQEKPPHVFGHGESGDSGILHHPRIIALTEAERPAPLKIERVSIAFFLSAFHAFPAFVFKSVRSAAPNALESRGETFGRLKYMASDIYQPVKNNCNREAQ
jgi:hypothetical protein